MSDDVKAVLYPTLGLLLFIGVGAYFGDRFSKQNKPHKEHIVLTCYRKEMNNFLSVQSEIIVINNKPFVCTKTNDGVFCQVILECP